ncbi:hypothetical protein EJB05_10351 [Eragrostis curvula]|uniref:HMG box domain-containing protein n=1 Tax=Eragrostis curvula TaxID=38414 RepID=A0A5J9W789_9POAL|nr:hypothetical protein EJB05_10351 [Eragrostis curvula]
MAGGSSSAKPAARGRKRVEATTVLKRSRDGSAFTRWCLLFCPNQPTNQPINRSEACNKDVPIVLIDMHSCSLDSKIRMTLEAQVVEKTVEITKAERKRPAASSAKGSKAAKRSKEDAPKRKRPPTAFFLFMYVFFELNGSKDFSPLASSDPSLDCREDFRKEYKAAHPDNKSVSTVAKEGGEKWRSMTEEEKKPYIDKAAELKAHVDNGEGSGENNVAVEKGEAADDEEQEVDQPADEEAGDQEEEEKNELDDDM